MRSVEGRQGPDVGALGSQDEECDFMLRIIGSH